jgi:hypothetical protein
MSVLADVFFFVAGVIFYTALFDTIIFGAIGTIVTAWVSFKPEKK